MIQESLPPLLRGLGTTLILLTSARVVTVAVSYTHLTLPTILLV